MIIVRNAHVYAIEIDARCGLGGRPVGAVGAAALLDGRRAIPGETIPQSEKRGRPGGREEEEEARAQEEREAQEVGQKTGARLAIPGNRPMTRPRLNFLAAMPNMAEHERAAGDVYVSHAELCERVWGIYRHLAKLYERDEKLRAIVEPGCAPPEKVETAEKLITK